MRVMDIVKNLRRLLGGRAQRTRRRRRDGQRAALAACRLVAEAKAAVAFAHATAPMAEARLMAEATAMMVLAKATGRRATASRVALQRADALLVAHPLPRHLQAPVAVGVAAQADATAAFAALDLLGRIHRGPPASLRGQQNLYIYKSATYIINNKNICIDIFNQYIIDHMYGPPEPRETQRATQAHPPRTRPSSRCCWPKPAVVL